MNTWKSVADPPCALCSLAPLLGPSALPYEPFARDVPPPSSDPGCSVCVQILWLLVVIGLAVTLCVRYHRNEQCLVCNKPLIYLKVRQ